MAIRGRVRQSLQKLWGLPTAGPTACRDFAPVVCRKVPWIAKAPKAAGFSPAGAEVSAPRGAVDPCPEATVRRQDLRATSRVTAHRQSLPP